MKKPDIPVGAVLKEEVAMVEEKVKEKDQGSPVEWWRANLRLQSVANVASHPPAWDAVCHQCAKRGHFQSVCRSTAKVGEIHLDSSHVGEAFFGNPDQTRWQP